MIILFPMKIRDILKITGVPVVFASLCCLSPVILVLLGISTVSFAGSLADTLYGDYKWVFRGVGLVLLIISLILYFRKRGVCTLDQAKRHRNEIMNTLLIALIAAVAGYFFFLYVVVEYIGMWLQIWS
ncbi:hypothetical protein COU78_00465 [Candidatus Peregrinibacteria bacterium CG10_big_fil_rev_8_21_14_0_10_49_24]|nr:MAG: hypothetical protein COV83_06510 [Candidatus Peregrinibacteria bacterium CG11_big_fil_rev_8_21_14_0_20_49_14]PIR51660.1 MAG: hypothetical protein COU78_00465 [Candidatus Peregrinibacteria bacterium CG10_big_fil_rev_8_21_14_0_10_49_24]PJA67980.1 MAG: hypothetical protein CO157_01495 [Candidatus Peregrinibacteria bacterium CG_4_9_14_3_um_filter_49_12]